MIHDCHSESGILKLLKPAIRQSRRDGRLRFIVWGSYFGKISTRRIPHLWCHWTNGKEWGIWQPGADEGEVLGTHEQQLQLY